MAIHLLIIDALNLIRRIHAVQGSPCLITCQNAIAQLIQHTRPTHAVAVSMKTIALTAGVISACQITKQDAHRCRTICLQKCPV